MVEHNYFRPKYIRRFNDLSEVVKLDETTESIILDFKRQIDISEISRNEKKKKAEELALDICQFANTWGGVLLIGVAEAKNTITSKKVAKHLIGVENHEEISQFINDSVLPLLYPKNISIEVLCIDTVDFKHLTSINVLPLTDTIGCVCSDAPPYSPKYPYRTHYGKQYLHPLEIEKRMSDSYRFVPIRLHELLSKTREVELYPSVEKYPIDNSKRVDSKTLNVVLKEVSNYEYRLNICGIDINIPFSLTRDVWLTENNKIGILLQTKLCISSDRKSVSFAL